MSKMLEVVKNNRGIITKAVLVIAAAAGAKALAGKLSKPGDETIDADYTVVENETESASEEI